MLWWRVEIHKTHTSDMAFKPRTTLTSQTIMRLKLNCKDQLTISIFQENGQGYGNVCSGHLKYSNYISLSNHTKEIDREKLTIYHVLSVKTDIQLKFCYLPTCYRQTQNA